MNNTLQINTEFRQCNCHGETLCGDCVVYREIPDGERAIIVMSDGLGHGERANILSSLAAEMMVDFIVDGGDIRSGSEHILSQLPDDKAHSIVYATFSSIDINLNNSVVCIAEHGNPQAIIIRDGAEFDPIWCNETIYLHGAPPQAIQTTQFRAQPEDIIIIVSDGVTQSGTGSEQYPFGWGRKNLVRYILDQYSGNNLRDVVDNIMATALKNDNKLPTDDITCMGIKFKRSNV